MIYIYIESGKPRHNILRLRFIGGTFQINIFIFFPHHRFQVFNIFEEEKLPFDLLTTGFKLNGIEDSIASYILMKEMYTYSKSHDV